MVVSDFFTALNKIVLLETQKEKERIEETTKKEHFKIKIRIKYEKKKKKG